VSKLQLLLLGHFECLLPSGERISLSMRKAEVLLAYLALAPGIRHPRERLINLLWSDRGEEQARNSLRQCLSAIKKSLGDVADLVLQIDRTSVCLKPEMIDIDAHEFERLATIAEFESLSDAAALYRGEFLEGISIRDAASQEWLDSERGRFKRQFIEVLTQLGQTQLISHDFGAAIKSAERLVAEDALGESGWRLLMRAYSENGDRSHALQAFKRCQQALRSELEVEPETATLELRDAIASGGTNSRPAVISEPVVAKSPAGQTSDDHSIAVLPFDNLSGDPEQEYFSDGISESIILHLNLFPDLIVKSRNSSFAFKQQIKSLGEISSELGVSYLVEGSVRKSEEQIRITVQLVEASSGNQVWGKRYDSRIENLFDLEEELSRSIAATVTGQIESDLQRVALTKGASGQQAYDLLLAGIYHYRKFNPGEMVVAVDKLNQCLVLDPDNVRAHAQLCYCHMMSWMERWVVDRHNVFELARKHALRAIELEPDLGFVQLAYAEFLSFNQETDKASDYVDRVLQENPSDAQALAMKSMLQEFHGDFEAALETAQLAYQLDPYHPWNQWNIAESQYLCGQFEAALETISSIGHVPGFIGIYNIAANVKLDRMTQAREQLLLYLQECSESMPAMPQTIDEWLQYSLDNAPFSDSSINQDHIDCLVQAGLKDKSITPQDANEDNDQPTILVLPFSNLSGDPEQEYFSDGISDSIIVSLSSFDPLNVKSRHTSVVYRDSNKSIEEIGAELGVQYIVEGSIRKLGDNVRITVQLGDTATGNQVWGKRYDSPLENLFELEEELVQTIAGTVSGRIEQESKTSSLHKPARDMRSYDYLMRGVYHLEKFTASDTAIALEQFQKCLDIDPDNAEVHAALAAAHAVELFENWTTDREASEADANRHIQKAVLLAPQNAQAHATLAEHQLFTRNHDLGLFHAAKAIELNPTMPDGYGVQAYLLAMSGRIDEALTAADTCLQIDPHHYYMGWNAGEVYRMAGQYQRAIDAFRSIPHISPSVHAQIAACLAALGQLDQAKAEMQLYQRLAREQMPAYPQSEVDWHQYWYVTTPYAKDQDFEFFFDQLKLAGLCDEVNQAPDDTPSIVVLPFKNMSGDPEQEYFSDGITSSLILQLGMFDGLTAKSQNSSFAFKNSKRSSREIADELEADFIIEGSIRKSGSKVRLSVQLVESASDSQIWGHQYDAELEDILDLEQELSQTVAATISGRIGHTLQQSAIRKPAKDLHSYDYLLRGLYHFGKFTARDLETARLMIEKCLEIDPDNATAHSNLGVIHTVELMENWASNRQQSGQSAQHHLLRALELDPENALVHAHMSEFLLIHLEDYEQSEFHADKAIELNPTASGGYAAKADVLGATRRASEAVPYADKSLQLDPYSVGAGWCAGDVYKKAGLYQKAIKTFRSIAHPPASIHGLIATCFVSLELPVEARKEMSRYKALAKQEMPVYPHSEQEWREFWRNNMVYQYEEDFQTFFKLLVAAGLLDTDTESIEEIPSIAVLPFENMSGDPEQAFFSDGITTDIVSTLSKFKHLRIVARHSTEIYRDRKVPIAEIAAEQGVRYILEGSVRSSGKRIRVSAELIDSQTEQNCWSERYDRDLDDIFAVQDEITQQITLAMKVHLDDGEMALQRSSGTTNIKAWELTLTAVDLADTYIRQNILDARAMAKQALELDPDYSYAWVMLAWTYWQDIYSGCESWEKNLAEAEKAVQHALDMNPEDAAALNQSGVNYLMRHDADRALEYCRRAVELEPGNAEFQGLMAYVYAFIGNFELARVHEQNMRGLCPIMPNWYYLVSGQIEQCDGDLEQAIAIYQRGVAVEPDSSLCRFYLVDALMQKGDVASAQNLADEIRALDAGVNGSGLVRSLSLDVTLRDAFHSNLAQFDLV